MLRQFLQPDLIFLDQELFDRDATIEFMADALFKSGKLNDKAQFIEAVMHREQQGPTALGDDLAIPHGKSDAVNDIGIAVVRVKEPMDWEGIDGSEPVRLIVLTKIKSDI